MPLSGEGGAANWWGGCSARGERHTHAGECYSGRVGCGACSGLEQSGRRGGVSLGSLMMQYGGGERRDERGRMENASSFFR
jgi:hypothetical protein